jgi:hypothetical protein
MTEFYNTTEEKGQDLQNWRDKAKSQEDAILEFFRRVPPQSVWPRHLINKMVFRGKAETTSMSRALRNLTKQGKLEKTDIKVDGDKGRKVGTWRKSGFTVVQTSLPFKCINPPVGS